MAECLVKWIIFIGYLHLQQKVTFLSRVLLLHPRMVKQYTKADIHSHLLHYINEPERKTYVFGVKKIRYFSYNVSKVNIFFQVQI